eukprot:1063852-Rhodomonas_salina.1
MAPVHVEDVDGALSHADGEVVRVWRECEAVRGRVAVRSVVHRVLQSQRTLRQNEHRCSRRHCQQVSVRREVHRSHCLLHPHVSSSTTIDEGPAQTGVTSLSSRAATRRRCPASHTCSSPVFAAV